MAETPLTICAALDRGASSAPRHRPASTNHAGQLGSHRRRHVGDVAARVVFDDVGPDDRLVDGQSDDRQLAERACALAGFAPRMTHTVDDYDLVLRMVAAGLGVGFVPELALSFSDTKGVTLRAPGGVPPLRRRIHALTRTTLATSPAVRALLSELR